MCLFTSELNHEDFLRDLNKFLYFFAQILPTVSIFFLNFIESFSFWNEDGASFAFYFLVFFTGRMFNANAGCWHFSFSPYAALSTWLLNRMCYMDVRKMRWRQAKENAKGIFSSCKLNFPPFFLTKPYKQVYKGWKNDHDDAIFIFFMLIINTHLVSMNFARIFPCVMKIYCC